MTIVVDGWAVVNRQGQMILDTVRRHKQEAIDAFSFSRHTWKDWERYGFRLCRVSIKEVEE